MSGEALTSEERLNGAATIRAFSPVTEALRAQAIAVISPKGHPLGLVTAYPSIGGYLCKASEVKNVQGSLRLRFSDGREIPAVIVGMDEGSDVGFLRAIGPFVAVPSTWGSTVPSEGDWVSCLGGEKIVKVGVVSGSVRKIDSPRTMLGIILQDEDKKPGAVIKEVFKGGAADRGKLREEDRILAVNDEPIADYRSLQRVVRALKPGTRIPLDYERGGKRRTRSIVLGDETTNAGDHRNLRMSGPVSSRRAGFEEVFQHDSPVTPESMGGPVVNLQGKVVGMNIARSDRVTTFALTPRAIRNAVARILRSSR